MARCPGVCLVRKISLCCLLSQALAPAQSVLSLWLFVGTSIYGEDGFCFDSRAQGFENVESVSAKGLSL